MDLTTIPYVMWRHRHAEIGNNIATAQGVMNAELSGENHHYAKKRARRSSRPADGSASLDHLH
jgi:hypothetical protein